MATGKSETGLGTIPASALGSITTGDQRIAPAIPLFIQIGRKRYQVESFEQASRMYCAARDAHGEGASKTPTAKIVTADGTEVARISYNGRVWPAGEWKSGATPLCEAA